MLFFIHAGYITAAVLTHACYYLLGVITQKVDYARFELRVLVFVLYGSSGKNDMIRRMICIMYTAHGTYNNTHYARVIHTFMHLCEMTRKLLPEVTHSRPFFPPNYQQWGENHQS